MSGNPRYTPISGHTLSIDEVIARFAARQHGLVTRAQPALSREGTMLAAVRLHRTRSQPARPGKALELNAAGSAGTKSRRLGLHYRAITET